MKPNRRSIDKDKGNIKDIASICNTMDRIHAGLYMKEQPLHRPHDVEVVDATGGLFPPELQSHRFRLAGVGTMPGVARPSQQSSDPVSHLISSQQDSQRRKVSRRSEDNATENGREQKSKRSSARSEHSSRTAARGRELVPVNYDHYGLREDSPRRVDFSWTHQLREVNWDGTYQDSLSHHTNFAGSATNNTSNSTITNSRDLRETDIQYLNFSQPPGTNSTAPPPGPTKINHISLSPPFAPPPSVSNSDSNCNFHLPPSSPATSSSSFTYCSLSSQSLTNHLTDQSPDVRWSNQGKKSASKTNSSSAGRGLGSGRPAGSKSHGAKLTHVDVNVVGGSRAGNPRVHSPGPSLMDQRHRELLQVRKHIEEKWATSKTSLDKESGKPQVPMDSKLTTRIMDNKTNNYESLGEDEPAGAGVNSPKRPRPVKMPITVDLKGDEILLKLKERVKHQRALALTSSSNDTSLANSSDSSSIPPALPPRHPLTEDSTPRLPVTRKVAISHPSPSYKGFSEPTADHTPSRPNIKISAAVKKKGPSLKRPILQPKKHEAEAVCNQVPKHGSLPPEKPKKPTRVIATAEKKSPRQGANKNIITTSSWRAGQELVKKELGLSPKPKPKPLGSQVGDAPSKSENPSDPSSTKHGRQPDGAEAASFDHNAADGNCNSNEPAVSVDLSDARLLSEDARSVLHDIQTGLSDNGAKVKSAGRPGVKRKAPKPSEPEKHQQPCEKSRHYDQESVRKFIATQKAKRCKKQQEEKLASKRAHEKKLKLMSELADRQKRQAVKSAAVARTAGEGERKQRHDERLTPKGNKENIESMKLEHEDNSTLTGDSADESTPQVTPRLMTEETNQRLKKSRDQDQMPNTPMNTTMTLASSAAQETPSSSGYIDFKGQKLNLDVDSVLDRFSQITSQRRAQDVGSVMGSAGGSRSGHPALGEFKLQSDSVFSGNHKPLREETAFTLGVSNSIARTNEERKQAMKATVLTLQSRLAEGKRKLEDVHLQESGQQGSPDFTSRFSNLIGNNNKYAVFTSNLPGSKPTINPTTTTTTPQQQALAATRIQAAYRGHNVRQALNWELPSGQTLGHKLKQSTQVKGYRHEEDDGSELTETSTFSEITATEPSDDVLHRADIPGNMRAQSGRCSRTEGSSRTRPTPATYKPSSQYAWVETRPDPYSVMSVFSRQSKYLAAGSRQADMPNRAPMTTLTNTLTTTTSPANAAFMAHLDLTSLKKPVITSTEHISVGQTLSGQSILAKTRYTRLEAGVSEWSADHNNSDVSSSQSESAAPLPSKHSTSQHKAGHMSQHKAGHTSQHIAGHTSQHKAGHASQHKAGNSLRSHEAGSKSEAVYTMTYESYRKRTYYTDTSSTISSDEDDVPRGSRSKKSDYNHQVSDAGLETDVSQMSEDEPRHMRSKLDSAASRADPQAVSHDRVPVSATRGAGDGRLSPNSLANKFSANLNYLESMEESLRQVVGMERTRGISLAQQETVSLAQVLKARQQEHNTELRQLQLKTQKEAFDASQQLNAARTRPGQQTSTEKSVSLLEKEDNLRPESRSRSSGPVVSSTEELSRSPGNQRTKRSSGASNLASVSRGSSVSLTPSVKTAEDSRDQSDSSIKTASDAEGLDSQTASIPEDIPREDSYSMSFDESLTDEESFRQVLPSESHRKELRRQSEEFNASRKYDLSSSQLTPLGDLSSLFVGEDSFNKFTAEMVRQVMREEEYRAQHQAALLSLREKALQEKAKVELAWLQQLKQKPANKGADDVFPNLDKRERKIRKKLQEQQAEIRRLQEANKMASKERQMLLQQHEEIAKIKHNTNATLQKLKSTPANGRLNRPFEVHTEDETEATSGLTADVKESKSDSEMASRRDKKVIEKQQKMRLDQKYMTAREQRLHERKKQAMDLLEWKKKLDAEEQKVYQLEKKAIEAWEGNSKERKREEAPVKKSSKLVTPSKGDDSNVISNRMLSSIHDELDGAALRSRTVQSSISEVISTQLSMSESVTDKRSRSSIQDKQTSPGASGSESSIPEDIPSVEKQKGLDSGDDTIITSIANDDYADTFEQEGPSSLSNRRKSPVGKLLPQGNSPLPSPWSRKTGSESESEDSISHTETLSDVSDYEVRIRQLSDELRRRRKEVEILKKERSQRKKEIFKAKEEAMKKQLEAFNKCIQQLKVEKDQLEHEPEFLRTTVKPQIKQPRVGHHTKPRPARKADETASNSSSLDDTRDSPESKQTSKEGQDVKLSPVDDKSKKKVAVSLMDRISEGSESDKSGPSGLVKKTKEDSDQSEKSSSVIEEISQVETNTGSDKLIQSKHVEDVGKRSSEIDKDEDASYTFDFSDNYSSLAQSHSKVPLSARSQGSARGLTDGDISEHIEALSTVESTHDKLDREGEESHRQDVEATPDRKSASSPPVTPSESIASPPVTGIQESDSDETESHVNSYQKSEGSSRPSSERSLGSNRSYPEEVGSNRSYPEEEEEDIMSSDSERTPVMSSQRLLPNVVSAPSVRADEDVISLPSISEKPGHSASYRQDQDMLDSLLGFDGEAEDEDEKTPVATPREMAQSPVASPREMAQTPVQEEENLMLTTDPLADFQLGDHVTVWGRHSGLLRFKGKVEFSPGIWAGVELEAEAGESDGCHEGKRYFSCAPGHGILVPGSEISAQNDKSDLIEIEEKLSADESLCTDEEDSNIGDSVHTEDKSKGDSLTRSERVTSLDPVHKPIASPVKRDWTSVGETITDKLTATLVEDTLATVGQVARKKSAPPTSPKPARKPELNVSDIHEPVEGLLSPGRGPEDGQTLKDLTADITADMLMKSLLGDAINDMMNIQKRKMAAATFHNLNATNPLLNGYSEGKELGLSFEDDREDELQDNDSGLSLEPIQRPSSPVPGDGHSLQDRKALNDEMSELFGEYIDDDLGFEQSTNSLKPYTGNQAGLPDRTLVPEEIPPVVPLSKEELIPIISRAVDIFWENRRYGESLEGVAPPPDFLSDDDDSDEPLVVQSRKSWKRMLFDLTGEIIRDIYKNEDKIEPPPWQRAQHISQKYFKGANPPSTIDGLRPVVQAAVFNLLNVNGTNKNFSVNKWNIRKRRDLVDSVLIQELAEEEKGWVDYSQDELQLKMSLGDSLMDYLLQDTVQTVQEIYQQQQHSKV